MPGSTNKHKFSRLFGRKRNNTSQDTDNTSRDLGDPTPVREPNRTTGRLGNPQSINSGTPPNSSNSVALLPPVGHYPNSNSFAIPPLTGYSTDPHQPEQATSSEVQSTEPEATIESRSERRLSVPMKDIYTWREVTGAFEAYIKDMKNIPDEFDKEWYDRDINQELWRQQGKNPEAWRDDIGRIRFELESASFPSSTRYKEERDKHIAVKRSRDLASHIWDTLDIGCRKPEFSPEIAQGALTFFAPILRELIISSTRDRYRLSEADGMWRDDFVRSVRLCNGWWEDGDEESKPVPEERFSHS
ncbi:uncharacterized protein I206_103123 [Kwoniella pini CBS 10737]|uniref:Uncharacterized protein n=1 Tax=Kwoniella pini CBS 10737 TaxID=1296096 RepID=A0A1B9IB00_9TREE|nr:uncharacterized protein I206_01873 [Kwoniella pini CBS 10737]OCF52580.1 hypothetical protein I206_01873 [Kwoniella pini CBS 10737]